MNGEAAALRPPGVATTSARSWGEAAGWLCLLGPFFFLSYGVANWLTSLRSDVGQVVFGWERHIPFLPWTIVPYWSIDLLYGLSLFVCSTRAELRVLVRRLLAAQVLSVAGFLLFPLRFTFVRANTGGAFGWLFDALTGFDRPFNQAPSLHIGLLVILWAHYAFHLPAAGRWLLHGWFALIGVSVLTTYQHHFIDVPTGAWVGLLCLVLFPWPPSSESPRVEPPQPRLGLAAGYLGAALGLAAGAWALGGLGWLLLWPSGALALVGGVYADGRPSWFRKHGGRLPPAVRWLLAPYLAGARVNSRLWTRRDPEPSEISDGVWLGRAPTLSEQRRLGVRSLVDVTAELSVDAGDGAYRAVPMLDLVVPSAEQFDEAAAAIDGLAVRRPTFVFCALGYSRSAAAVVAWLVASGGASSVDRAVELVRARRPRVVLTSLHVARLREWAAGRGLS